MIPRWIEKIIGPVEHKKRYRQYKQRTKRLPDGSSTAIVALERYLMYRGLIADGEILMSMLEDLADLFELSITDGIPVRDIVGEDPVEFAETFVANYADGQWIAKEQARLTEAINCATEQEQSK